MCQEKQLLLPSSTPHRPPHPACEHDHPPGVFQSSSGPIETADIGHGELWITTAATAEEESPKLNFADAVDGNSRIRGRRHGGQARIAGLMAGLTVGFASLLSPTPLGPKGTGYLAGHRDQGRMNGWGTGQTMGLLRNKQPAGEEQRAFSSLGSSTDGEGFGRTVGLWESTGVDLETPGPPTVKVRKCGSFFHRSVAFAGDQLFLEEDVETDSYDSGRGEYGGSNRGSPVP